MLPIVRDHYVTLQVLAQLRQNRTEKDCKSGHRNRFTKNIRRVFRRTLGGFRSLLFGGALPKQIVFAVIKSHTNSTRCPSGASSPKYRNSRSQVLVYSHCNGVVAGVQGALASVRVCWFTRQSVWVGLAG